MPRFDGREEKPAEEQHVPSLCQRCTSGRPAQINFLGSGWVCWPCYDELKPQSPLEAELERRIDANPQWRRGEDEPRSAYRKRMLAEWRGMGGVRRMPT